MKRLWRKKKVTNEVIVCKVEDVQANTLEVKINKVFKDELKDYMEDLGLMKLISTSHTNGSNDVVMVFQFNPTFSILDDVDDDLFFF